VAQLHLHLLSRTGSAREETRNGARQAVERCRRQLMILVQWSRVVTCSSIVVVWWESTQVRVGAWLRWVVGCKRLRTGLSNRSTLGVRWRGLRDVQCVAAILWDGDCCR
jgi:hypothetical protein